VLAGGDIHGDEFDPVREPFFADRDADPGGIGEAFEIMYFHAFSATV
jgi:hypothetical protein